jgi:hypothetical protein
MMSQSVPREWVVARQHGAARDVIDWMAWLEHVDWVLSICDTTTTALSAFRCFERTASAERGRHLEGVKNYV